jgi:hypothetical protein
MEPIYSGWMNGTVVLDSPWNIHVNTAGPRVHVPWRQVAGAVESMRESINARGWVKGTVMSFIGVCAMGAYIYSANRMDSMRDRFSEEGVKVAEHLESVIKGSSWFSSLTPVEQVTFGGRVHGWDAVITFNDRNEVTRKDVIAMLDTAIESALEKAKLEEAPVVPEVSPIAIPYLELPAAVAEPEQQVRELVAV